MKNIYIKSLLLIVAIMAAAGCVLYFIKTVVEPPTDPELVEVNNASLTEYLSSYSPSSDNLKSAEDSLNVAYDRISIFYKDSLISSLEKDKYVQDILSKYTPQFKKWAYSKFNQNVWSSSDHKEMQRIIKKLRGFTIEDGAKVALTPDQNGDLSSIEGVLSDYNDAWKASKNTGFRNGYDNISKANSYKNKPYIKNCTALVTALNDVPRKVMLNHYNYVLERVNSLKYPSSFSSRDSFNSSASNVYSDIESFRNASYGVDKSQQVNYLLTLLDYYKDNARNYTWSNYPRYN